MSRHQNISALASSQSGSELTVWTFRRTQIAVRIGFQAAFSEVGLNASQAMIMLATPEERWIQQVELQQLTELSETKLVSPLEELVRRGLIIREQDPADRRRNRVRLTSDGLRLADAARDRHAQVEEMLFGRLSLDERRLLAELLERVAVNVRLNQNDFEKFDQRIVG